MSRIERPLLCIAIAVVGLCIVFELVQALKTPASTDSQVRSSG